MHLRQVRGKSEPLKNIYHMEHNVEISRVIEVIKLTQTEVRLGLRSGEVTAWSKWLIEPSESYVEVSNCGPVKKTDLEWLEINAVELKYLGKLIKPEEIDHSEEVTHYLDDKEIKFECVENRIYRIPCR